MGSAKRRPAIVTRDYQPGLDHCARALELLLSKSRNKKAAEPAPEPDGHDGTKVKGVSADAPIIRTPVRS